MKKILIVFTILLTILVVSCSQQEKEPVVIGINDQMTIAEVNLAGEAYYGEGDYKTARAAFEKALKRDTNDLRTLNNLSITSIKLGDYDDAMHYSRLSLDIDNDEDNLPAYFNMGLAFEESERYSGAAVFYSKYLEMKESQSIRRRYNNALERIFPTNAKDIAKILSAEEYMEVNEYFYDGDDGYFKINEDVFVNFGRLRTGDGVLLKYYRFEYFIFVKSKEQTRYINPLGFSVEYWRERIQVEDYNFDGYPDFAFASITGMSQYATDDGAIYFYNPNKQTYEKAKGGSGLMPIGVDKENEVVEFFHHYYGEHWRTYYKIISNQLVKIKEEHYIQSNGSITVSELIDGEWVTTTPTND